MDECIAALTNLSLDVLKNDESQALTILDRPCSDSSPDPSTKLVLSEAVITRLKMLCGSQNPAVTTKLMGLLATLAKIDSVRTQLTESSFVPLVMTAFESASPTLLCACCRAVGNLCFENAAAQKQVLESGKLPALVDLLNQFAAEPSLTATPTGTLSSLACKSIHNIMCDNGDLQKELLGLDLMKTAVQLLLRNHFVNPDLADVSAAVLHWLTDSGEGMDQFLGQHLVPLLKIINSIQSAEVLKEVLNIFGDVCHNGGPNVLKFVESGGVSVFLDFLGGTGALSADQKIRRKVLDMLVLVTLEDSAVGYLYLHNTLLPNTMEWLDSDQDYMRISACLILGNFAREDHRCSQFIQGGLHLRMSELIKQASMAEKSLEEVVACLGVLKNLSVAAATKPTIIRTDIPKLLFRLSEVESPMVKFKSVQILRILCMHQDDFALTCVSEDSWLRLVIELAQEETSFVLGPEAFRMIASLIKGCKDIDSIRKICSYGGVKAVFNLLKSDNFIIQNEGVIAINILLVFQDEDIFQQIMGHSLVDHLEPLLTSGKPPLVHNALSVIAAVVQTYTVPQEFGRDSLRQVLFGLSSREPALESRVQSIIAAIDLVGP